MKGIFPDADPPDLDEMLDAVEADVLVVGHTHVPMRLEAGGKLVVNPGALLRDPAKGFEDGEVVAGRGTFGILVLPARRFAVYSASDGGEVGMARSSTSA